MPLGAGTQLGHYKVQSLIGMGGMGEVYRAVDTKLEREVAIKVLPAALADDAERLARFEREAKVLAQLNHPGIAAIHGVEDRALVMELVPGPTLADRIKEGPIPASEAEEILLQIADALEYAHERGVIHRDLKPANIKIDPDGRVKILDFGLAKALTDPGGSIAGDPTNSPTVSLTIGGTVAGTLLGTAAYMAPEQARGKKVDKRADIWAFGVVAWEMLTGERLFQGEDTVQVLGRVLEQKIDLDRVASRYRQLLARCLTRNPKDRLRDIGEARFLLSDSAVTDAQTAPRPRSRPNFVPWAVACIALLALAAVSAIHFREQPPAPSMSVRFQFNPEKLTIGSSHRFAISPDGTKLAYYAAESGGVSRLWIHAMDTLESRPLSASLSASSENPNIPLFWSDDSRFVFIQSSSTMKKIDVSGGSAQSVCDVSGPMIGGSANRGGTILFGSTGGIMRVSSEGAATPVTLLDPARGETAHYRPVFLPDGKHFLYLRLGKPESTGIYIGSLDARPEQQASRRVLAAQYSAEFVPSQDGSGEMLFLREGTLLAQPFDLRRLELTGEAVPVAGQVTSYRSVGNFSSSQTGILVYRSGAEDSLELAWFDRQGKTVGAPTDPFYGSNTLVLSPDGTRAVAVHPETGSLNLWLADLARGGRTPFTYTRSGIDRHAAWSPDGTKIAFSSNRDGYFDLYQHAANGAGEDELLLKSDSDKNVLDWSRDGRSLLFNQAGPKGGYDLWVLSMDNQGERKPASLFLHSEFGFRSSSGGFQTARFSPDSRWVAYDSSESGTFEIYVRPFPTPAGGGGKWMVSQNGGGYPRWRGDGKELFYLRLDGELMAADVSSNGAALEHRIPKPLFKARYVSGWDVSADGKRFLFPIAGTDTPQSPFTVVLNWMSMLKK